MPRAVTSNSGSTPRKRTESFDDRVKGGCGPLFLRVLTANSPGPLQSYAYILGDKVVSMIEAPVVSIHIPLPLRGDTEGAGEVTVSGETVGEALAALGHEHPAILARLLDEEGNLRPYMNVYLHGVNILTLDGLATDLASEDVLTLISMDIDAMAPKAKNRETAPRQGL